MKVFHMPDWISKMEIYTAESIAQAAWQNSTLQNSRLEGFEKLVALKDPARSCRRYKPD
jgi:hypothetical protein